MTPDELVEKVRVALVNQNPEQSTATELALVALRAVREAMQEPDEGMRAACRATTGAIITRKHCDEMWQGMLAAHPISRIDE